MKATTIFNPICLGSVIVNPN